MVEGHTDETTAAILDSQSVKTTGKGEDRGYDAGKHIKGRKRFLVVDTLGFILCSLVVGANWSESAGGCESIHMAKEQFPTLQKIWADSGYRGSLVEYAAQWCTIDLEIVRPKQDQQGFVAQRKRWIVERIYSWLNWWRRLSKDYETTIKSSESMITVASIRMLLKRIHKAIHVI